MIYWEEKIFDGIFDGIFSKIINETHCWRGFSDIIKFHLSQIQTAKRASLSGFLAFSDLNFLSVIPCQPKASCKTCAAQSRSAHCTNAGINATDSEQATPPCLHDFPLRLSAIRLAPFSA
jgi:hypothetical protein